VLWFAKSVANNRSKRMLREWQVAGIVMFGGPENVSPPRVEPFRSSAAVCFRANAPPPDFGAGW